MFAKIFSCNQFGFPSFKYKRGFFGIVLAVTEYLGATKSPANELSDQELVARMNHGDDQAFEELYHRYFDKIYAFTIRRVTHHEIAEDIVSKVFMKAFANRQGFVWKVSFSAWIYRIATNTITDHYRTKKNDAEFNPEIHDKPVADADTPGQLDIQILGKELERILEQLKERERMAVSLKYYSELSNQEIAQVLHCKPEHVAVIVHRALKKCQALANDDLLSLR